MDDNNDNKITDPKKKYLVKGNFFKMNKILVVVLGEVNVGKSNIVRRLLGHDYEELEATIGVEFGFVEVTNIDKDDPSVSLNVQVWDTCKLKY
jgi:GTPase SAR1 family protein